MGNIKRRETTSEESTPEFEVTEAVTETITPVINGCSCKDKRDIKCCQHGG
jgi:hypothetical protein